jgi:hypothetical protein
MSRLKYFAVLITSLLIHLSSFAAENITVSVAASIPSADFYVRPEPGTNLSATQWLHWDIARRQLDAWTTHLDMKNSSGGIIVRLDAPAVLYSGRNRIDLAVILRTHELADYSNRNSGCVIVPADEAARGVRYKLAIEPITPRPPAGSYSGVVSLVFEPEVLVQAGQGMSPFMANFLNQRSQSQN